MTSKLEHKTKLDRLAGCLLYLYDSSTIKFDESELLNDIHELDDLIVNARYDLVTEDDIRWSDDLWNKYDCDSMDVDLINLNRVAINFNAEGQLIERSLYKKNSSKNFLQSKWYDNGHKESEGSFKDDKEHGKWTTWWDNGQKWTEGDYKNGKEHGLWISLSEFGDKIYEGSFKDGNKDGEWALWLENRQKWHEENWKEGKKDGLWIEWYENGHKQSEGSFKDGKEEGKWFTYWSTGPKWTEGDYIEGKKHGEWIGYLEDGTKYFEEYWINGVEDGKTTWWHFYSDNKDFEKTFKDGQIKSWIYWYESGEKKEEKIYRNGQVRLHTLWYESGKKKEEGRPIKGLKALGWTYYNENGTVREVDYDDDDILIGDSE